MLKTSCSKAGIATSTIPGSLISEFADVRTVDSDLDSSIWNDIAYPAGETESVAQYLAGERLP